MRTAVVILNWNTREYLGKFLPPLLRSCEGKDVEVVVADNASTDGSLDCLRRNFPSVRTVALDRNYGFTGGYNRALAMIDAEYYVLINSDIEVCQGWIDPLVRWMDTHHDCGACAPKLLSWYDRGSFEYAGAAGGCIDSWGYTFCRGRVMDMVEKDTGQYDASECDVAWATGACLMVRSSLWRRLGGLDDRFFAHMEEIDLCWRMRLSGYSVTVVPYSIVYHLGGGTLPKESPWKLELNYRNNLLLLENNLAKEYKALGCGAVLSVFRARLRIFLRMLLDLCSALVYLLTGKSPFFAAVIKGHCRYFGLRHRMSVRELRQWNAPSSYRRCGYFGGSMVLSRMLKGSGVFDYLRTKIVL